MIGSAGRLGYRRAAACARL